MGPIAGLLHCRRAVFALLASASVTFTPQLAAQTTAEASDDSEIIVTARKREEPLEKVPLSITVVGADTIQRANLDNISDIAQQTPGLSFRQGFGRTGGGGGAGVRPSIRGMSSVVGAPNAAFFLDGIFISDNISSYQLDNLERVEVIKGPQSALFGRQTFAGAVSFVSRKPTNEFQGRIRSTVGEFGNVEVSGYVSGPIVRDLLLFEINARYFEFGGDYVNADSGKRDLGAQQSRNFGGRLVFTPGSNFEAIASLNVNEDKDKGYIYGFQGSTKNNCFAPPIVATVPFPRTNTNRRGFFCGEVPVLPSYAYNNDAIEAAGFNGLDRRFVRATLSMTYTADSKWSITSLSAFNTNDSTTGQDNTLLPSANPAFSVDNVRTKDFSQELRIMSPQDAPIRGLVGAYHYREDQRDGFQFTNTNRTRRPFLSDDGVRSTAIFGMIEAQVTQGLTLGAEARYQWERILGSTEVLGVEGQPAPAPTGQREAKFNAFLPRFTAAYAANPDLNIYASAAKGNKPGGFNAFPLDAVQADLDSFTVQGFDVFSEETAWSYELGAKGRFGAMNWAVAGFYTDWKQQQLSRGESYTRTNGTPNSVVFIQNAGQSRIQGFEIELNGRPAPWLFLRGAYTFVDAKFTEFYDDTTEEIFDTDGRRSLLNDGSRNPLDVDGPTGDLKGNRLPQTPQHQFVVTAQANLPLRGDLEFVTRGDLSYESKRFSQVDNLNWAGDSFNLNMIIGLETRRWSFNLFARNLLADKTPLVVTRLLDFNRLLTRVNPLTGLNQTTFFRDFSVSAPRRRQFGLNASYRF